MTFTKLLKGLVPVGLLTALPSSAFATANLASLLRDLDRVKEAEALYRRALDGSEQALGPSHTTTLAAACNLADVLQEAGQLDEAEPLWRAVVVVVNKIPVIEGQKWPRLAVSMFLKQTKFFKMNDS